MNDINGLLSTSGIAQFALLIIMTFFACSKVTLQGRVCRKYLRNSQDSVLYNSIFFSFVAISLSLVLPLAMPTSELVFMAVLNGALNMTFQVLYSVSLASGPVSLTVVIINFSVLVPTALSFFAFGDSLYFTQLGGIVLLMTSMLLSFNKTEGEQKANKKWMILTLICFAVNGAQSCLQKLFYATETANIENTDNTYLVVTYVSSIIIALGLYFIKAHTGKKEKSTFWFSKNVVFYAMAIGIIIAIFQKLFMLGVEKIDGTLMFPTYYGLQSVFMTAIGIIMFKDPLTQRQKLGALCGIASIALMNLKIGTYIVF